MVTKSDCPCGWKLPYENAVFKNGDEPTEENVALGYYVAVTCPQCERTHTFVNAKDPDAFMEVQRQNKRKQEQGGD